MVTKDYLFKMSKGMMTQKERLFFELLQVAIGNRSRLSSTPTLEEWEEIQEICKKQTMVGIGFMGMKRLPQEQWPQDRKFIMRWTMRAEKIKARNEKVNTECAWLTKWLEKENLHSCILKGQANLKNYCPTQTLPCREGEDTPRTNCDTFPAGEGRGGAVDLGWYRTPGDIDVWVWSDSWKVSDVIRYVLSRDDKAAVYYHHSDGDFISHSAQKKKTEIEIHHRPSWMSAPWRNRVFQRFCEEHKKDVTKYPVLLPDGKEGFFYVPSVGFDAVYQLVHIYRHLFYEGIGLRQMLDYYMTTLQTSREGRLSAMEVIAKLGMKRFASSVMWVLQEVFAMPNDNLLCQPNEKHGRFLLNEIMLAGNFGHEDERINVTKDHWLRWGLMKLKRNMKFLTSYPEEVICEPLFRVFHWFWRTFKLWK